MLASLAATMIATTPCMALTETGTAPWQQHARKGSRFLQDNDSLSSQHEYQQAISAAEKEKIAPAIILDLQLNLAQAQIQNRDLEQAEKTLKFTNLEIIQEDLNHSIVELHYWRRMRALRRAQKNFLTASTAGQKVLEEISHRFGTNSQVYQTEMAELGDDAIRSKQWELALQATKSTNDYWQKRTAASMPPQGRNMRQWLQNEMTAAFLDACDHGAQERISVLKNVSEQIHGTNDELFRMWVLMAQVRSASTTDADTFYSKAKKYYARLDKTQQQASDKELLAAAVAHFWRHLGSHNLDPDLEQTIKTILRIRLPVDSSAGAVLHLQVVGMYAQMLAKDKRLAEAERVASQLVAKRGIITKVSELDGPVMARFELARQFANQKNWTKAHAQINALEALLASQPNVPNQNKLLAAWKMTAAGIVGTH